MNSLYVYPEFHFISFFNQRIWRELLCNLLGSSHLDHYLLQVVESRMSGDASQIIFVWFQSSENLFLSNFHLLILMLMCLIEAHSPAKTQAGGKLPPTSPFHYSTPRLFISWPAELHGCSSTEEEDKQPGRLLQTYSLAEQRLNKGTVSFLVFKVKDFVKRHN